MDKYRYEALVNARAYVLRAIDVSPANLLGVREALQAALNEMDAELVRFEQRRRKSLFADPYETGRLKTSAKR